MKSISQKAAAIAPSATLAVNELSKQMRAAGQDVIGFGVGEPDFDTPQYIKDACVNALNEGATKYTPAAGTLELRKSISSYLKRKMNLDYAPNQIIISSGAKHSIFLALGAIIDDGDEVILPSPYWVSYYEAIRMHGGIPVIVETDDDTRFKMTPDMLRNAITDKTKCLILTNPSNPTGMLYSQDELAALAEIIVENDIYVIADEIYYALTYKGNFTSMASISDAVKDRTIMINGVSKTFAMTGWRIGFTAAGKEIINAMTSYQSHSTGAPGTMNQVAAEVAYDSGEDEILAMVDEFDRRRKYFVARVASMPYVSCIEPDGAFYIFMNVKGVFGKKFYGEMVSNCEEFTQSLLKNALVAVVPGTAFGAEGYVRWSYACSMDNIEKGLDRLADFLAHAE